MTAHALFASIAGPRALHQVPSRHRRHLATLETLESRQLLAVDSVTPAIFGTVFQDLNGDTQVSAGERLAGANVILVQDDGDGVYEPGGVDAEVATLTTDANGEYCFDNLDPDAAYFVVQPAQTVVGVALSQQVSDRILPGAPGLLIDGFVTTQTATASPPAPSSATAVIAFANESEVIGAERDILAELISGDGELSVVVNPFGGRPTLRFNADVAVTGAGTIAWDGVDLSAGTLSMGLGGRDLTQGGAATGIVFRIGASIAGATAQMRLYQGNDLNFSLATLNIPVTTGGAADSYAFIPFNDFFGAVSPTDVDAIELILDANNSGANAIELALIGSNGAKPADFLNVPSTDLAISKTNNRATAVPGESLTYTVVVTNNGPSAVLGAEVMDDVPGQLLNPTYTSVPSGGATGNTSGSGDINDLVNLPVGSSITYTVSGIVNPAATGTITNIASINAPTGIADTNPNNNNAVDVDTLIPTVDLVITKTDDATTSQPGSPITYTIVVSNLGPSTAAGAVVEDLFDDRLNNVSYSSTPTGSVTGNTASGLGDIRDTVNMAPGSSITYVVNATIDETATTALENTAQVITPMGTTDTNPSNNQATDQNSLRRQADLSITKTNGVSVVDPGDQLNYVIVVRNDGPSAVSGVAVMDGLGADLMNVTYTSVGSAGVTGNTVSGAGAINDLVSLPVGATLTYNVAATVRDSAGGTIQNTAQLILPSDTDDPNLANNSATDQDSVNSVFDLAITKSNGVNSVVAGEQTTYTIQVTNAGPSRVVGATVQDHLTMSLVNASYTSTVSGGATGNTANGTGNINDLVTLPAGSSITYTATGLVPRGAQGTLQNTAQVLAPDGLTDSNPANNQATDSDAIARRADVRVTKTSSSASAPPGETVTYEIVVSNAGPSNATGVRLMDTPPSSLVNPQFTSVASGEASGNTNGSGAIDQTLNLPVGGSVRYTLTATVAAAAVADIVNQAVATVPTNITDPNPANNSAMSTVAVDRVLRSISGFVYVDSNDDGIFDTDEQPIAGVQLNLEGQDDLGNAVNRAATTSLSGLYQFNSLPTGNYSVQQVQPPLFNSGRQTIGSGSTTNVVATENVFANIGLGANQDAVNFNFGESRVNISKRSLLASSFGI
jgi:uncharacterized repeat protein (TIGR01451 family)